MYNELIKKISEAETPFQPMGAGEISKIEAEETAKLLAKKAKADATELKCPSCGVDLKEEGLDEDRTETIHRDIVIKYEWDEGSWSEADREVGDNDSYEDDNHESWRCPSCGEQLDDEDFNPDGEFM